MAEYDGSVKINTEIDSAGFYEGIKKLSSKTMSLNNAIKTTQRQIQQVKSEMDNMQKTDVSAGAKKLESAIKDTETAIEKVKSEMDTLDNTPAMTEDYKFLNDNLEKAKAKLVQLQDKQEKMANLGKENSASWKSIVYDIEQVKREISSTSLEMQDMRANDEAFTVDAAAVAGKQAQLDKLNGKLDTYRQKLSEIKQKEAEMETSKLQSKQAQLDKLNGKLNVYNKRLQEAKKKEDGMTAQIGKIKKLSAAIGKLAIGSGSASKGFTGIGSMLSMLTSRLGNLALSAMVFNVISKGLTKVREELVKCLATDKQFSSGLAQVKGNLYTAFYPIYSYALPAINALMNGLGKITGTIATFTSTLFGASVGKSQQAAKSLLSQAKAIDDVGNAAKKASGNLSDIDDMHILTDDTESTASNSGSTSQNQNINFGEIQTDNKFLQWLDSMKLKLAPLKDAFDRLIQAAKPLAGPLFEGFIDGLTDLITSDTAVGIINSIADALENMDPDDAYAIGKALGEFANALLIIVGIGGIVAMITGIATAIGSIAGLGPAIAAVAAVFAGWKIGNGIYELITGEKVDMTMWEQLDEIFGTLITDSGTFFDGLGWMLYDTAANIAEAITGEAMPSWEEYKNYISEIWGSNGIYGIIETGVAGFLSLIGMDSGTIKNMMKAADNIYSKYKTAFGNGGIKGVFNQFQADANVVFSNIGLSIQTFFTNMRNQVVAKFQGIGTQVGMSVRNAFAAAVNQLFSSIESRINYFVGAINGVGSILNEIPGVYVPWISKVHLPRLATGTVVPANYGEFQAILGDNKRAPEVVSPVPTMKQAVREVLEETGGSNNPIVIHNYVTLDGKVIYSTVVEYNNREIDMTGSSPLFE